MTEIVTLNGKFPLIVRRRCMHSLKHVALTLFLSVVSCLAGESEQATPKQIQDLIGSLPSFERIQEDFALTDYTAPANDKQREANARLKKASEGFQRLRSLLRVGTSVFDYPGLLALSRTRYIEFDHKYAMALGVPSDEVRANGEGLQKDMFDLVFDDRGIITAIRPLDAAQ